MPNAKATEYFKSLLSRIDGITLYACATASTIGVALIIAGAANAENEVRRIVILLLSPVILLLPQIRLNQLPKSNSKTKEFLISTALIAETFALFLI